MPISFRLLLYYTGFNKLIQVCSRTVNIEFNETCKNIDAIYTAALSDFAASQGAWYYFRVNS